MIDPTEARTVVTLRRKKTAAPARAAEERAQVALLARPGALDSGSGRYTRMVTRGLADAGLRVAAVEPHVPEPLLLAASPFRRHGLDLRAFLGAYPIAARFPPADLYHLTSQNLAALLLFCRPPGRVVVTVHDIIPYLLRDNPLLSTLRSGSERLLCRMAMAGLARADRLVADSWYTKSCLVEQFMIQPERIDVVYPGIDHQRYRPQSCPPHVRERHGLRDDRRYLIYVGSEDPRKNLGALLRGLALLRRDFPDLELLKVGRAQVPSERQRLVDLAADLGVGAAVHFLEEVPEEELPLLYSLSSVCVMPSLYEGFGFPVLEAMACGTPVVYADAGALLEIGGRAGLRYPTGPDEHRPLAACVAQALDPRTARLLRSAGMAHSAGFRWPQTVNNLLDSYQRCEPTFKLPFAVG
jgi:glycosyltransferase involved in cell wall biosynthesis